MNRNQPVCLIAGVLTNKSTEGMATIAKGEGLTFPFMLHIVVNKIKI